MKFICCFIILLLMSCKSYTNLNIEKLEAFDLTYSKDPLMYLSYKNYKPTFLFPFIINDSSIIINYNYKKSSKVKHSFVSQYYFTIQNVPYMMDVSNPLPFYCKNGYIYLPQNHNYLNYNLDTIKLNRIKLSQPTKTL
jgi:hypothetical protein